MMFAQDSKVRVRGGELVDLATDALAGVDEVLAKAGSVEWYRICDVPEERLDEIQASGEANTGKFVYNLNNIYRLRISEGFDVWAISRELEALSGIMLARPVPKPMTLPWPPDYEWMQGYLDSAGSTPTGIDAEYAWTQTGGSGMGVTVCDLEYSWNYNHLDVTKAFNSQINSNVADPFSNNNHGTAVIGELVSDNNTKGTTGICWWSNLKTCGTYYGSPTPYWNVPGAMAVAIANLSAGDVILLEQQWDYFGNGDHIPIEWWTDYSPYAQSYNGVYAAIVNAIANGIHVVEAGGNSRLSSVGVNTDNLIWYGNSGAIIVGAGGVKTAGQYPEGDLERLYFSAYGSRFDLQGWGEEVVTTGYGHLYSSEGVNLCYTDSFSGTSSAAPIVAGAVACCVGYWKAQGFSASSLTPAALRNILVTTGTPQVNPGSGHIGPRPDLLAAFPYVSSFVDVTSGPLGYAGRCFGVAWGDYDNDGDQDLYTTATCGNPNKLLRNDGGGVFADATSGPLGHVATGAGVAWGDYDNDGDIDLFVGNSGTSDKLFRNDGGGNFFDATSAPLSNALWTTAIAWVDYDNDGKLDIYVVQSYGNNKLFHNDGGGNFSDASSWPVSDMGTGSCVAWADYDNDGDQDFYLSNYGGTYSNRLIRNDGGGNFTLVTPACMSDAGNGTGVAWGDYDNDGDLDLYLANFGTANKLFRNDGGGNFTDVTAYPLGDAGQSTGCTWADYDNDGDLDLYMVNWGGYNKLFENVGGGSFIDATPSCLDMLYPLNGKGVAWGDHDNDGDLDLYLAHDIGGQPNKLMQNQIGSANHWLFVDLVGTISNRAAIGARVRVVAGGFSQIREISGGSGYLSQNSLTAEFGLGSLTPVDTVEVKWPSGQADTLTALSVDTLIKIYEGGSVRGDANGDGVIDLGDVVYLLNYLYKGGPTPNPLWTGDTNSDGVVDIGDVVYLLNYLYKGGPPPCSGKEGGFSANAYRLSGSLGRAEISLLLQSDPTNENLPGFAKVSPDGFDEVSEISVVGKFDRDVAGMQLEIDFNPDEVTLLDPALTPLTKDLQLFAGIKDGTQKMGIVDLNGENFIPAGEGTLVNLRAKGKDLTSIKIKKAILVDINAVPLDLEISSELILKEASGSSPLKRDFQESRPQNFLLSQNYPNPFNPETEIKYALPQDCDVKLIIYNILGEKVKVLLNEHQIAGFKTVHWDGKDEKGNKVASGVYFYRLEADKFSEGRKMLLVK